MPSLSSLAIIDPSAPWKWKWDIFIMVMITYSAVAVPTHICFETHPEGALFMFEACISLVFLADLTFNIRTAFYTHGEIITDPNKIVYTYLSGWFWIDAPSSIPIELIELSMPLLYAGTDEEL